MLSPHETIRLTIAITTRNRADFIGATLNSIMPQLAAGVELLVLDGASTDNTPELMAQYKRDHPQIRYVRQEVNNGPDRDFSRSVELAVGDYCWLMPDDDLLLPGAVQAVLSIIAKRPSLVVVNAEVRNPDMSVVLERRRLPLDEDRCFTPDGWEEFFVTSAQYLTFIGGVVIRRDVWLERDRERYFGSLFVHLGVIFQRRLPSTVWIIAKPFIAIRYGNAKWRPQQFEVWMCKWPELVWSFSGLSEAAKRAVCAAKPWREVGRLLFYRATGAYSINEYRAWIKPRANLKDKLISVCVARMPKVLANTSAVVGCQLLRGRYLGARYVPTYVLFDLTSSPYFIGNWLSRARLRQAASVGSS